MKKILALYRENKTVFVSAMALGAMGSLVLLSYSFLRSVADSLFIHTIGSDKLHLGWIYTGAAITVSVLIYNRLVHRVHTLHLFGGSVLLSLILGSLFWLLLHLGYLSAIIPFYVFKEVYIIFLVEQIWTLCSLVFAEKSAKLLYGFFMTIATTGAVGGNIIAASLVHRVGTLNIALFGLGSLALIVMVLVPLMARPQLLPIPSSRRSSDLASVRKSFGIQKLWHTGYLKWIFFIVLAIQMVTPFIELQFSRVIEREILNLDDKTEFMEWVWTAINSVSLVTQLVLAAPILVTFGVGAVLWFVPAATLGLVGLFMTVPQLWAMSVLRIFNKAMDYSIYRAAKEILYLPFDYEAKNKAKALIDVWMYRFGKTIAGLVKGGLGLLMVLSEWRINILIAFIVVVWLILTGKLTAAYKMVVETFCQNVSTETTNHETFCQNVSTETTNHETFCQNVSTTNPPK